MGGVDVGGGGDEVAKRKDVFFFSNLVPLKTNVIMENQHYSQGIHLQIVVFLLSC